MSPVVSIVMFVMLYMATECAGAISAILVNAPCASAAAVTALDCHPMRLNGEADIALMMSILSAGFGSSVSIVLLILTSTWTASFALTLGPTECFAIAVIGLSLVSWLAGDSLLKRFVGLLFGMAAGAIGSDPIDGVRGYVFIDGLLRGITFLLALLLVSLPSRVSSR